MQVSVEKVSNVERRLTIVVPANQVEEAFEKQIDHFAKNASIKGFRPGKAPLSYIKKRFGEDARKEAVTEVMQKALYQAISEEKLYPISTPKVESKGNAPDQPLEFTVLFEVLPEIGSILCNLTDIEKAIVDVTEEDVQRVIKQLLKQYTKWHKIDREAQLKDRVVIDYYAIYEGKSDIENTIKNFPLELGSNIMLPGFEEGLLGSKPGEERKLNLTFPEDFQIVERAGKPIEFVVTIKEIYQAEEPILGEDFAKQIGIKSGDVNELHTQVKQSLEQERTRLVIERLKEQVFKQLLEQNPIDVPQSLIQREANSIHDEVYQHQEHHHHEHSEDEMATFNEIAKKRVALGLLIAEFAKQADLKIDNARITQRINEIAASYENPSEVIAWLSTSEQKKGIETQVMEDQVLEKLIENVPVTEKVMTYAELKGIQV